MRPVRAPNKQPSRGLGKPRRGHDGPTQRNRRSSTSSVTGRPMPGQVVEPTPMITAMDALRWQPARRTSVRMLKDTVGGGAIGVGVGTT